MGSEVFGDGGTFEEGKGGACVEFDEGEHGFIIGEDKEKVVVGLTCGNRRIALRRRETAAIENVYGRGILRQIIDSSDDAKRDVGY